jgi:hypothetical protein
MSKRRKPPSDIRKLLKPSDIRKLLKPRKSDHRLHPTRTVKGRAYIFVDKHHHPPKGDHACWLRSISRDDEFLLFQEAETGNFEDEKGHLWNVHRNAAEEYLEIGTRHELMAIFWNPHSASEWHGHPRWPVKTSQDYNRKNQGYEPPRSVMETMVRSGRVNQRDAERIMRGDYP